ncbi:TetR/AcrR family transcriptional regulator [Williamsia sterculiae]|uniref:Transcriptional regulator, TetR family n=1 Tax=Williamsia sterculiae TaxID=1344003 RepID=A0A1N7GPQ3_9NOCA|nr:TetR/AcrR family transcriptional regulator [Williamsia sterculiae]SIS14574.1 transcriptional regulator, TetR family [Williamsia sterculiae]
MGRDLTAVREPKQDRSRATRERLLSSTIELLARRGWDASTVSTVAAAAGVSRGAAQHHFPTREALITAALEQVFEEMTQRIREVSQTLPDGPAHIHAVVERAVDIYTGMEFKAALQVWAAAASDSALRDLILPLEGKFARAAHRYTMVALGVDPDDVQAHRLVQATLDLARGLGLADTLSDDSARRAQVIDTWSRQLALALA